MSDGVTQKSDKLWQNLDNTELIQHIMSDGVTQKSDKLWQNLDNTELI